MFFYVLSLAFSFSIIGQSVINAMDPKFLTKYTSIVSPQVFKHLANSYMPYSVQHAPKQNAAQSQGNIKFICFDGDYETNIQNVKKLSVLTTIWSEDNNNNNNNTENDPINLDVLGSIGTTDVDNLITLETSDTVDQNSYSFKELDRLAQLTDYLCSSKKDIVREIRIRKEMQQILYGKHPQANDLDFRKALVKQIKDTPDAKKALQLWGQSKNHFLCGDMLTLPERKLTAVDALLMIPNLTFITQIYLCKNKLKSTDIEQWNICCPLLNTMDVSDNEIEEIKAADILFLLSGKNRHMNFCRNKIQSIKIPEKIPNDVYEKYHLKKLIVSENSPDQSEITKLENMLRRIGKQIRINHGNIKPSMIRSTIIRTENSAKNFLRWLLAIGDISFFAIALTFGGYFRQARNESPDYARCVLSRVPYTEPEYPESASVLDHKLTRISIIVDTNQWITPKSVLKHEVIANIDSENTDEIDLDVEDIV